MILRELCQASSARCAALVDREGETVDYGGRGDPFDIRIQAAEWRLVLQHLQEARVLGSTHELVVRARRKSFLVAGLPQGYALVVELGRRATGASDRALKDALRRLCEEAGFQIPNEARWRRVVVDEERGHTRRPEKIAVEGQQHSVTVLGRITTPKALSETSFRIRIGTGEERTLVREPLGIWYLEEEPWSSS